MPDSSPPDSPNGGALDRRRFIKNVLAGGTAAALLPACGAATAEQPQKAAAPAKPSGPRKPLFKFGHVTDSHVYGRQPEQWNAVRDQFVRDGLREVAAHDVDFVLHTGDFCTFGADPKVYGHVKELYDGTCRELGIPWYIVRGNHDTTLSDEQWAEIMGHGNYHFGHKGWEVIALDRYYRGYQRMPNYFDMNHETVEELRGFLKEIDPATPIVLALHENPVGVTPFHRGEHVLDILEPYNVRMLLFGHVQCNYISNYRGIPHLTVVGDGQGFDSGALSYAIVTCYDNGDAEAEIFPYTSLCPKAPAAVALSAVAAPVKTGSNWTSLRGPSGTRRTAEPIPATAPRLAWEQRFAGDFFPGGPTLLDGRLYVGTNTRGGLDECGVFAVDAATGEIIWTRPADGGVQGGVRLADGSAWFGTTSGSLYRVALADGGEEWRWNNFDNMPIGSEPWVEDGLVHAGGNWEMYAVDAKTGRTAWRKLCRDTGLSYFSPGHSAPLVAAGRVFHQRPYNGQPMTHDVQSVNVADGTDLQLSDPNHGGWGSKRHASPLLVGDKIVTVAQGLLVLDPKDITVPVISVRGPEISATPAVSGDIAVASYHNQIRGHDLGDNGKILWKTPHEPSLYHYGPAMGIQGKKPSKGNYAAPLVDGERVLVADTAGNVRCLGLTDGQEQWRLPVGAPIISAPLLSGNTLFVASYDGMLRAFTT